MPSSPTKPQRSVLFKVTIPSRIENIYQTSSNRTVKLDKPKLPEPEKAEHFSKCVITKTIKEAENCSKNAMYHELRKTDLRHKLNTMHNPDQALETVEEGSVSVIETLKNSSHGKVPYNRNYALSEVRF